MQGFLRQTDNADMVGRGVARSVWRHIGHHKIGLATEHGCQAFGHAGGGKIPFNNIRAGNGLDRQKINADNMLCPAFDQNLRPAPRCGPKVHHFHAGFDQAEAVIQFNQFKCRRATNGRAFLRQVQNETGVAIDIISGREEASLAVESCSALLHDRRFGQPRNRALLFDIGGGSTEIAWVRTEANRQTESLIGYLSLPIGVITLWEQFGPVSALTDTAYRDMVDYTRAFLRDFESVHRIGSEIRRKQTRMIGTSGTVTTLASLILNLPRYARTAVDGTLLPAASARLAVRKLRQMGLAGIEQHPCIGPDRAPFVLPGCAIFEAIHDVWPVEDVIVADRGLRDGMISRMIRSNAPIRRSYRPTAARRNFPTPPLQPTAS